MGSFYQAEIRSNFAPSKHLKLQNYEKEIYQK
jgi:hypothetical protein